MEQMTLFDLMYPRYQITGPIRLIELFSGIGSQAMALRDIGVDFETWRTCEWEVNAVASYKAIHFPNDNTDYSHDYTEDELIDLLYGMGISGDGKNPFTREQIAARKGWASNWLRTTYNNIRATKDLVNICVQRGGDLGITNTDHFTYIMTYSFP